MKIRNGFVSNSSSGSFILNWRMKNFGKDVDANFAEGKAFGVFFNENGNQEIDWENTWNKESKEKVEEVISRTVKNSDGTFTTTFWTSMFNNGEDFGESAKSFLINIMTNNSFKIIDNQITED